jgi:hypothetical protein
MAADMQLAATAFEEARRLKATPKVMLSLFEAGLVESGMRNLNYGADDSLGYLQQRPSQGWPSPMNVSVATRSYVTRALTNEKKNPGYSAGKLAQSVQRSAYPDRYDQREKEAKALLDKVSTSAGVDPSIWIPVPGPLGGTIPIPTDPMQDSSFVGAIGDAANALKSMVGGVSNIGTLATQLTKLAIPSNFVRLVTGTLGITLLFIGIILLGRQVKNG